MLARLHVQNFKCLRDVEVAFGPFTVLIGPNDSGKSSILDALRLLGRTVIEPLPAIFHGDDDLRQLTWKAGARSAKRAPPITLSVGLDTIEGSSWRYELNLGGPHIFDVSEHVRNLEDERVLDATASDPARTVLSDLYDLYVSGDRLSRSVHDAFHAFFDGNQREMLALGRAPRYRLNPDLLRTPAVPTPDAVLSATGDNLAAVLDRLITGPDRSAIARLEQALNEAVPTLRGIALRTIDGKTGAKALEFVLSTSAKGPPVTIPCAHASDGAMLLTAFLALAFSDDPGLILIEEPENGLHPSRLQSVIDMLRKISEGVIGNKARQVIITTHSPLLLNYARPEEVRIVRRDPETGTLVTPMSEVPDVHELLGEFAAGELWYLLGEQALVEGKKP
jgi:predicted ATPase